MQTNRLLATAYPEFRLLTVDIFNLSGISSTLDIRDVVFLNKTPNIVSGWQQMHLRLSQSCLVCKQASGTAICQYCFDDLTLFDLERYQHNLMLSPNVNRGLPKVDFPQVLAIADYQWPLSKLLTGLKFAKHIPNAQALAAIFVKHCLSSIPVLPQLIIPMPLHKNRYFRRTFNQSIELSKQICKQGQLDMDTSIISRCISTPAQTALSAAQRRKNLRNAFKINDAAQQRLQRYKHIALFDDVITTGSTMNAAYLCLRKQHPRLKIDIWSICLTLSR